MGRPNLSMVLFLFVAAVRAILAYLLRRILYFYVVHVYGASTLALIYLLATLSYRLAILIYPLATIRLNI